VLVVDDSVVIRRLVSDVLSAEHDIEVVGTAVNGRVALDKLASLRPDIITLDIEMPEMDGIATLQALRAGRCRLPVIMFSTLTERGASATLEALSAGASDYVTKPANMGSVAASMASVREQLVPRIRALCGRAPARPDGTTAAAAAMAPRAVVPATPRPAAQAPPRVVAIGCSTGGPTALTTVLMGLSTTFPLPIVVVQHMPPVFTAQFAARLDRDCPLHVVEATSGHVLAPGTVYIAAGDHHLEVAARGASVVTKLHQGPQVSFCRPSVDVLFNSVAATYDGAALAVMLTGMGRDGRDGSAEIHRRGGTVIVQDEATSVVWSMPGAVASAGLADEILPISDVAAAITRRAGRVPIPARAGLA
jgi:two-component system chemotaxis response regulator CheB